MAYPQLSPGSLSKFGHWAVGAVIVLGGLYGLPWIASKTVPQPVQAVITGPTHAAPATVVELSAEDSKGSPTLYRWDSDDVVFKVSPDGKKVLFSLDHRACAKFTLWVTDGKTESKTTWTITANDAAEPSPIPGPKPDVGPKPKPDTPPDNPNPPPQPKPDVGPAAGEFGIAPRLYEICKAVNSPVKAAECKSFAAGCEAVAAKIVAGGLTNAVSAMSELEDKTTGMNAAWNSAKPDIKKALSETFQKFKDSRLKVGPTGEMVDRQSWGQFVREIGQGPGAVK